MILNSDGNEAVPFPTHPGLFQPSGQSGHGRGCRAGAPPSAQLHSLPPMLLRHTACELGVRGDFLPAARGLERCRLKGHRVCGHTTGSPPWPSGSLRKPTCVDIRQFSLPVCGMWSWRGSPKVWTLFVARFMLSLYSSEGEPAP